MIILFNLVNNSFGGATMNKKTLIEELSKKTKLSLKESKNAIEEFQSIIIEALKRGDTVNLMNFGSFKVIERKARVVYNPVQKRFDKHQAKRVPIFKCGVKLKNEVA